jgi:hypothetical protein
MNYAGDTLLCGATVLLAGRGGGSEILGRV